MPLSNDENIQKITSCFLSELGTNQIELSEQKIIKLGITYTGCVPDIVTNIDFLPLKIILDDDDSNAFYLGKTGTLELQDCSISKISFQILTNDIIETDKLHITYEWQ